LIGLGCGVEVRQRCVVLTAYLQDMDSGTVVAACREFTDPPQESQEPLPDFCQLAAKSVFKQVSFASLGAGQMLIQGGKRSPNYQFRPNTGRVAVNLQTYEWELLKPPLLVEDFASLQANLEILSPASLRPRRLIENFCNRIGIFKYSCKKLNDKKISALQKIYSFSYLGNHIVYRNNGSQSRWNNFSL